MLRPEFAEKSNIAIVSECVHQHMYVSQVATNDRGKYPRTMDVCTMQWLDTDKSDLRLSVSFIIGPRCHDLIASFSSQLELIGMILTLFYS